MAGRGPDRWGGQVYSLIWHSVSPRLFKQDWIDKSVILSEVDVSLADCLSVAWQRPHPGAAGPWW